MSDTLKAGSPAAPYVNPFLLRPRMPRIGVEEYLDTPSTLYSTLNTLYIGTRYPYLRVLGGSW